MSACGLAPRPGWGFLVIEGPDTWSFLGDLVSQDLEPLVDGTGAHSLLLSPQGKLEADFRILRVGDEAWLDGPDASALADGLRRFKIRVDVEILDRSADREMVSVRGVDADVLGVDLAAAEHAHCALRPPGDRGDEGARLVRVTWRGAPGFDVVGPPDELRRVADALVETGVEILDDAVFERLRIEAGVPLQGMDIDGSTIPQEAFLDEDAVSFTKGCFLGQELVCRIDTRGRVTRFLRQVEIPESIPDAGTELTDTAGKVVGTITSVAPRPEGGAIALAMIRRVVEPPAQLTLRGDASSTVRVLELPGRD